MLRIGLVCVLFFAVASVANAGLMTISLDPTTAGPYVQGATVTMGTDFHNNASDRMVLRLIQFSSDASEVMPTANYNFGLLNTVPYRYTWNRFPSWPYPQAAWSVQGLIEDPNDPEYNGDQAVIINPGGTWVNGTFPVVVPTFDAGCDPEVFWSNVFDPSWCDWAKVDIITGTGNPDQSGRVRANFEDPLFDMTLANGGLQGGIGYFYVLPEPASLGLLGLGMLVVLRRRR